MKANSRILIPSLAKKGQCRMSALGRMRPLVSVIPQLRERFEYHVAGSEQHGDRKNQL
jgi:hypothetical protein